MSASTKKEMKRLYQALESQGFHVEIAKNGHYKVIARDGRTLQIPSTPALQRNVLNAISRLKRIGYVPPQIQHAKKKKQF